MNGRFAPHRMPLPPPVAPSGHTPAGRGDTRVPSAMHFVSMVVLATVAVVMAITLAVAAVQAVPGPFAVVLVAVLAVAGLMIVRERPLTRRPHRGGDQPVPTTSDADGRLRDASLPDASLHGAHAGDEPRLAPGWGALGALSVALLVLALVVPDTVGVALAAIGLAGLFVFRLAAMYGGWAPQGHIRASLDSRPALECDARAEDGASRRTAEAP